MVNLLLLIDYINSSSAQTFWSVNQFPIPSKKEAMF